MRPLAFWDCGSNPARGVNVLFLAIVVCSQVEVSVSGRSLVQGSATECGISECDHEASIMRRPWPTEAGVCVCVCAYVKYCTEV